MSEGIYRIGDLARLTKTKVVTIRYYETIGLMPKPLRSGSGNYRLYGPAQLDRLRFIRRCRDLGFSLDQIRGLAALASDEARPCAEVDALTRTHLAEIEARIADLTALSDELRRVSQRCDGGGMIAGCRILQALNRDGPVFPR